MKIPEPTQTGAGSVPQKHHNCRSLERLATHSAVSAEPPSIWVVGWTLGSSDTWLSDLIISCD